MTRAQVQAVVAARLRRGSADARRLLTRSGSARAISRLVGPASRNDLSEWNAATSSAHDRMRTAIEPARGASAIVCVSMRPYTLEAVVKHVSSQRAGGLDHDPDIVFVANSKDFERSAVEGAFSGIPNVRVVVPDEPMILGAALNIAAAMTDARFVAKFDDDDLYGPCHLADSLRAHSYSGAGVVGKHSYYADLIALDQRVIRFPANEYRYSSALAGGTLVWDRERTGDLAFMEVNLGEDQAFISDCHRRGVSSFSADRFNFVQVRASDNTWTIDDDSFLDGSTLAPAIDREVFR